MRTTRRGRARDHVVRAALRSLAGDRPDSALVVRALDGRQTDLVESAIAQGTGPALASMLTEIGGVVPADLRSHVENARFARAASVGVLRRMTEEFDDHGIPFVVLKGIVLASVYPRPEVRAFNDIDVLVEGRDLGRALDALERIGARDVNRNWGNYLRHGVAETPVWTPGIGIDLHWHLVGLERERVGVDLDIASMIGRRRTVDVGGLDVWTLDPTDLLLHTAVHAGRSGATKLAWLRDVRELVRAEPPDWDVLVRRSRDAGVGALVGQVLDRARCELGADVPIEVTEALCPRPLLWIRRRLDLRDRGDGLPRRFARGFPVVISRASIVASGRAAAGVLATRVRGDQHWDVGDPEGPLYWDHPSGGSSGRQAYLEFAGRAG